jgi:hypothetical protein
VNQMKKNWGSKILWHCPFSGLTNLEVKSWSTGINWKHWCWLGLNKLPSTVKYTSIFS